MADGGAVGSATISSLLRYLQVGLLVPLLGYAGVDLFGERRDQAAQDRMYRALTTKQVQQCLVNAEAAGLQMSRSACEDIIGRWYDSKPLSAQQHALMAGWAFGDFEPTSGSSSPRSLVESREAERVYSAGTDGLVLVFATKADGSKGGLGDHMRVSIGADANSLADTKCLTTGQGAICAVSRGQSWVFPSSSYGVTVNWLAMPLRDRACCLAEEGPQGRS